MSEHQIWAHNGWIEYLQYENCLVNCNTYNLHSQNKLFRFKYRTNCYLNCGLLFPFLFDRLNLLQLLLFLVCTIIWEYYKILSIAIIIKLFYILLYIHFIYGNILTIRLQGLIYFNCTFSSIFQNEK